MIFGQPATSLSRLLRNFPRASSPMAVGVTPPSASAASIAMPDTPNTSVATLASLILAVSSSFRVRFRSVATVWARDRRYQQQITQLSKLSRGDETRPDRSVPNQIADPLRVPHIGLASRHILDVMRVTDNQRKMPGEDSIDGHPIYSSTLAGFLPWRKLLPIHEQQGLADRFASRKVEAWSPTRLKRSPTTSWDGG
jgi:hypothetical protein